jgi:hypothetical protein
MNPMIRRATQQRRILVFRYDGLRRTVEPHIHGLHATSGREIVYGIQIGGGTDSGDLPAWRSYYVDKIEDLHTTEAIFTPQAFNLTQRFSELYARA